MFTVDPGRLGVCLLIALRKSIGCQGGQQNGLPVYPEVEKRLYFPNATAPKAVS